MNNDFLNFLPIFLAYLMIFQRFAALSACSCPLLLWKIIKYTTNVAKNEEKPSLFIHRTNTSKIRNLIYIFWNFFIKPGLPGYRLLTIVLVLFYCPIFSIFSILFKYCRVERRDAYFCYYCWSCCCSWHFIWYGKLFKTSNYGTKL